MNLSFKRIVYALFFTTFTLLLGISYAQEAKFCSKKGDGLPPDTQFIANSDGSLTVQPPDNWFLLTNQNGKWQHSAAIKVTCTCNSGNGGCSPGAKGDSVACVMTTCSNCSKSTDSNFIPVKKDQEGITFANKDEIGVLPPVDKTLLSIPEVKAALAKFKSNLNIIEGQKASKLAMVRIYGRIGALEIPDSARLPNMSSPFSDAANILIASNITSIKAAAAKTCTCNSGGSCPHDSVLGVHWCDASNCKSCTMSGG